jgi:hypothetical protein
LAEHCQRSRCWREQYLNILGGSLKIHGCLF